MNHLKLDTEVNRNHLVNGIESLLAQTAAINCSLENAGHWEYGGVVEDELSTADRRRADFEFYKVTNSSDTAEAIQAINNARHPFPEEVEMLSGAYLDSDLGMDELDDDDDDTLRLF